jgi:hypothetical protein
MKSLRLLSWLAVGAFCIAVPLCVLLRSDGPRYRLLVCLTPLLAGVIVGSYLGDRSFHHLAEFEDPWRVALRGSFSPRGAFTRVGWRLRVYSGIAVLAGLLGTAALMAFFGF